MLLVPVHVRVRVLVLMLVRVRVPVLSMPRAFTRPGDSGALASGGWCVGWWEVVRRCESR